MSGDKHPLGSTYRLQLFGLGFTGARDLVPYLSDLGIETLYVSPVLAAAPGSPHGYDVIDPERLDPALGTPAEFEALLAALDGHRMRLLIDIVPNHMAAQEANRWWWDVLRQGQGSVHATAFDIDWSQHGGRVLLPTLAHPLADLEPTVEGHRGEAVLALGGQRFPLRPGTARRRARSALTHQHYRPAFWRLGPHEGNYRRFFDIDGLVGVRVEDPAVFERTHALIMELGRDERIAGFRIDHVDGLTDPLGYAARLRRTLDRVRRSPAVLLVEKILSGDEALVAEWPVDGTTGYEFANVAGGLFVDGDGAHTLAEWGSDLTGQPRSFSRLAAQGKREVLERSFPGQLDRLAGLARQALDQERPGHDLSLTALRGALTELTVHLDVYRTYFDAGPARRADLDRLARAAGAAADVKDETWRALGLLADGLAHRRGPWLEVAQRWQQLTGAVMAKGVEDTATYRYPGPAGHADVGGDPDRAAATPAAFHRLARQHRQRPSTLNATSTHDSKRSEDARARLYALCEAPGEWAAMVERWHRRYRGARAGPDALDELVAYTSLLALWPAGLTTLPGGHRQRAQDYAVKAAREAGRRTSWVDPEPHYERELRAFIAKLGRAAPFGAEMGRLVDRIDPAAATISLSMLVLKAISPGVPDFYQGTELWDFSLTDPDNRRPVDFAKRRSLLSGLPAPGASPGELARTARTLLSDYGDGRLKLFLTRALLHLRRGDPALFDRGTYRVLEATGPRADHVVAVARQWGRHWVIALVPRQTLQAAGPGRFPTGRRTWASTAVRLPPRAPDDWRDVFTGTHVATTGSRLSLGECLSRLPVSVLSNLRASGEPAQPAAGVSTY
ncbi:MAG TPA: malto-oligosyltrehalose synthase [Acidimicrobiales bacterium]|jgi:malto-oligosyltrehalose synthase